MEGLPEAPPTNATGGALPGAGPTPWSRLRQRLQGDRLVDLLTVAVAFALWRLFFPGLMSADSIAQYGQAVTGRYNDWQPPLLAIVLKVVLASGGGIGLVTLGQCVAGTFGIRALATSWLAAFYDGRLPPRRLAWISLTVLVLLLAPITPLAFHLMTFWKDTWAMALLCWLAALALDGYRHGLSHRCWCALAALGGIFALVRHNAVVVLPVLAGVFWLAASRWVRRRSALALALAPAAIYLVATPAMRLVFGVEPMHTESAIMALDLVGICAKSEAACDRLPWTAGHILDRRSLRGYRPGDMGFIFWDEPRRVDTTIREDFPRLRAEYLEAAKRFPGLLARVKLEAFATQLGTDRTFYFFHDSIVDNPYGLTLNPRFAPVRAWLSRLTRATAASGWRWISGVHLVWMLANVAWIAALLLRPGDRRRWRFLACVLLLPLAYALSYLLATPIHDFRFIYPATVFVQCVTLSSLLGWLLQNPIGRIPYRRRFSA